LENYRHLSLKNYNWGNKIHNKEKETVKEQIKEAQIRCYEIYKSCPKKTYKLLPLLLNLKRVVDIKHISIFSNSAKIQVHHKDIEYTVDYDFSEKNIFILYKLDYKHCPHK
jgi:hypothetical protein